jgi:DAK2 domain fusion protein YloV
MAVTSLDGRAFGKFLAAGTYFLRKYRGVLDDLNVFPVPDGDTGSNMYLTARAALRAAAGTRNGSLAEVAAAAADGSLLGARGNSGVILAQMFRGFAHAVRHRDAIDTRQLAAALNEAVVHARAALTRPVEGTIVTVAQSAAEEAHRLAAREPDFYRHLAGVVRAANDALERTPEQLPALREAGVVDSGGAGYLYFMEGALSFLPDVVQRSTAFPRRPVRSKVFTRRQVVGELRFCTEFVLEGATLEAHALRDVLAPHGDSLIVAGTAPTLKVHLHTAQPQEVQAVAGRHGTLGRLKIEDMAHQHHVLVVDVPQQAYALAAVVPGPGFERIARELGAEVTIPAPRGANPSVEELLIGVNACIAPHVYLLANDPNVALAARQLQPLTEKTVTVVPARDVIGGLAVQLALAGRERLPDQAAIDAALAGAASAAMYYAGKDASVGGVAVRRGEPAATLGTDLLTAPTFDGLLREVVHRLAAGRPGLVTLYYGGKQKERDAQRHAADLTTGALAVEYYFGGQAGIEYWLSFER